MTVVKRVLLKFEVIGYDFSAFVRKSEFVALFFTSRINEFFINFIGTSFEKARNR